MLIPLESAVDNQILVKKILLQLGKTVIAEETQVNHCGLLSGLAGQLLFQFKLSDFDTALVNEVVFSDKLDFLQQQLANYAQQPDLNNGLSGQAWFLEFINQAQGQDYDADFCEEVDDILADILAVDLWQGEIEMVLGLSGIAMYAGRRSRKSSSTVLFERIINHFENLSIKTTANTLSWSQPSNSVYRFNKEKPEELEFNLGLAHGVPSIIAALLPALNIPSLYKRTKSLLVQSCDWLIEQQLIQSTNEQYSSCFDSYCTGNFTGKSVTIDKDDEVKSGSRLGWCYGDLTIALTLARVGNALELPSYLEKAKEVGLLAAKRDSINGSVYDAGICHGSAGLALIFQLLHQQLKEPELLQAANKWLIHTLELYREKGIAGLYMYSGLTEEYQEDVGLLMGLSGIGLCLLSALGQEADWADSLLMA